MDTLIEDGPEIYVGEEKLSRITEHLESIDPVLVPFAHQLALPPYRDLSNPQEFARHTEQLDPADLVAIHLTDAFPTDGKIHPTAYYDPKFLRFSLHFTINSVPEDINFHGYEWSWKSKKYAILIPFDKMISRVDEYNPGDTIIIDDLDLPAGTVIIRDKNDPQKSPSSSNIEVIEADYSQNGEGINGFHRAVYEEMIKRGYFPQKSNVDTGWYSGLWSQYRHVHQEFCLRNDLVMGIGHARGMAGHWSAQLEQFSYYLEKVSQGEEGETETEKEARFRDAVEEAKERFLETDPEDIYALKIPPKYKQALIKLLQKYGQQFPEIELLNLD